ncbi:MAG: STAS domain-containing protein [Deltaproteobacteria bacterium]|nr:STAS domain-containing protein [Deltaproteobacteria bacterium]
MLSITRSGQTITITGAVKVQYLEPLKEHLDGALGEAGRVVLDVGPVEEIDAAGLQFLTAFILSRGKTGGVALVGSSPSLDRALALAGLSSAWAAHRS